MTHTDDGPARPPLWRPTPFALILAALAFAASLTPSLVPRDPLVQGVLSGVIMGVVYGLAAVLVWLWRLMLLPEPDATIFRRGGYFLAVVVAAVALWHAPEWQNATRAALNQPPVALGHRAIIAVLAVVVFALLWAIGTALTGAMRWMADLLGRVLPGRVGPVLAVLLVIGVFAWAVNGALVTRVLGLADAAFAAGEQVVDPRFPRPADPMKTGSSASLIGWDELGNRGRDFVGRTPPADEIAEFTGGDARTPVRVYVGRISADTARARAELALEELIRVGGFEREILIVTTPVGTGWMDPGSHDAIDFMFGGDTAHVGAQYSYLTSVLSILTNVEYGLDQARALFDVIHGHWTTLPKDDRPRLYIHGLSQGSLNSQASLPFYDMLPDPVHGAFWAGSPFIAPIWADIRRDRNADSPVWLPRFGNGSLVRVATQDGAYEFEDAADWGPIRLVFLHYPSDPLVVFQWSTLWRRPDWLGDTRPPDVAPQMRWYPVVTGLQLALDMMHPISAPGFGHYYIAEDYIDGWAALTDPPDWSAERAQALKDLFRTRPAPW